MLRRVSVAFTIFALFAAPAFATVIFDVDFDAMPVGMPPSASGPPNGPTSVSIGPNTSCTVMAAYGGLTQNPVVLADWNTASDVGLFFSGPQIISGMVQISWSASAHQLETGGEMSFGDWPAVFGGAVYYGEDGLLWVIHGDDTGSWIQSSVGHYFVDQPQLFTLLINLDESTFSLSINGVIVLDQRPTCSSGGTFSVIRYGTHTGEPWDGTGTNSYGFDNLRIETVEVGVDDGGTSPGRALSRFVCYPNPFNPRTTVSFALPADGHAVVAIYNAKGQMVTRLVDDMLGAGAHAVDWLGTDTASRQVPSGTYFCRLETAWGTETRKLSLVR